MYVVLWVLPIKIMIINLFVAFSFFSHLAHLELVTSITTVFLGSCLFWLVSICCCPCLTKIFIVQDAGEYP